MAHIDPPAAPRDPDPAEVASGYEQIITRFTAWAGETASVGAAAVIGSRARTDHPADAWADLDIIILASDPIRLAHDPTWAGRLGDVWISFVEPTPGGDGIERRVMFAGGLDVDFALFSAGRAGDPGSRGILGTVLARGARILVDKDGILGSLSPQPPGGSETPAPDPTVEGTRAAAGLPDAAAVEQVAGDFWYHAVWTAKHLRRGELWWAKGGCDGRLKELLRTALEWDAAQRGRDPWFRGRFLEEWADPDVVARLRTAFARYDEPETWNALGVTMDLFAVVARRVSRRAGVPYPEFAEARARELVAAYGVARRPG